MFKSFVFAAFVALLPSVSFGACPGNLFYADHTAPGSVFTLVVAHNSLAVLSQRVAGNALITGSGGFSCGNGLVEIRFRGMSHGIEYDCSGRMKSWNQTEALTCTTPSGSFIGHIQPGQFFTARNY
ncbi:hypothetical protein [Salipiger thiooxidans]|uniref:hypothetical protein n=1 Tax=Salipiger thiooxidans TaxID=282683 RepID=UPI001CFA9009|nr:hypothetical protein [Salipiger thiooxidans]